MNGKQVTAWNGQAHGQAGEQTPRGHENSPVLTTGTQKGKSQKGTPA